MIKPVTFSIIIAVLALLTVYISTQAVNKAKIEQQFQIWLTSKIWGITQMAWTPHPDRINFDPVYETLA